MSILLDIIKFDLIPILIIHQKPKNDILLYGSCIQLVESSKA